MLQVANKSSYKLIVTIWLTLSVFSLFVAAYNWTKLDKAYSRLNYNIAIRSTAGTISALMVDNESAMRGYVISGSKGYLDPYYESLPQINQLLDQLLELTQHDKAAVEKAFVLRSKVDLLLAHHKKIIEFRKSGDITLAQNMVRGGEGKDYMDDIRRITKAMIIDRNQMLHELNSIQRDNVFKAGSTSFLAGLLGLGAGGFAFYLSHLAMRHQVREKELVEAKLVAERHSEEKTVFLANMSHEIRTPMNAILGFCELLMGEIKEPKQTHYLKAIYTSGRSLLQLINDILDMSKIEAGVMQLMNEAADPREICQFIKTVFKEPAVRKGIKLECYLADDLPHAILIDRIRLRQILLNLVGNAVKFTDSGEIAIRVSYEQEDRSSTITLTLEVQDTGVGIPHEKLETIFLPFVQAGAHKDKEKKGTGLGLSIVKRLVDLMGGTITVASILEKGSAFSIRIPHISVSARVPKSDQLEVDQPVDFNELKPSLIFAVDDNSANLDLLSGIFSNTHHRLEVAASGKEVIEKLKSIKPDIILMDIRMPRMDGPQTLKNIRNTPGFELIPVIAITASTLLKEEGDLKRRFNGYIRKPFSSLELYNELSNFIPKLERTSTNAEEIPTTPLPPPTSSPELLNALRHLKTEIWEDLQNSQGMSETQRFAEHLLELAQKHQSAHLERYAKKLKMDAEHFNIIDVEELLNDFPELVNYLTQHQSS
ncbi:MAG: ATP-binding protein [Verrucomicrobiota bacterium]